jgi:molybdenum cofactor biosynthesis enzyme MoaA
MLGNLNEQDIEQILHGPVMQEIRQTLRQGRMHPEFCQNCIQAERYGRSERDWHNRLNPWFDPNTVSDHDHQPVLIDVRWNITCNLSCNYCGDKCSSKWADLKGVPVRSGTRPYIEQVCEYLAQHQHSIRQVALVGGEPLLLKENESVLAVTPELALVNLITNLSVNLDTNRIFQRLAQRQRVGWNVSFDNVGPRFEYVRHGGSWDLIESNIQRIRQCAGHEIGIHAVYNVYNATRLEEFVDWAKSRHLDIHWQSLFQPEYLDPLQLGPDVQHLALNELRRVLSRADLSASERGFLEQARKNLEQVNTVSLIQQFTAHITEIESTYHPDQQGKFHQLWPEISNLL